MENLTTVDGEELLVPTFEIACNPTIKLNEIRAKRYHLIDYKANRVIEPLFEIEDYISEKYWPEWEVNYGNDDYIVQAPNAHQAIEAVKELRNDLRPYGQTSGIANRFPAYQRQVGK
jgi:hypothetical protein